MSFVDSLNLTADEKRKVKELGAIDPEELIGKVRGGESAARGFLGNHVVDYLLKHFKVHDHGKADPPGKLGAFKDK